MASSCSLGSDGRAEQLARYAGLAPNVVGLERELLSIAVDFGPDLDRRLLDELVAVERECCPFLAIEVSDARLTIAVERHDETPMLDVFAELLSPRPARSEVA